MITISFQLCSAGLDILYHTSYSAEEYVMNIFCGPYATGARKLEQSDVAIDLARIEKTGDAIQNKSSFFFGANSADMGHLLANPNVIKLQK